MPHILPTLANETISEDIGDYYPVFCSVFAQAVETLRTYEHDWSAALFFTIYGWKQDDIFP